MKPKTIQEIVEEYRSLFSTGHSEMQKDELVFVPDKKSKRGEDWLRTTLTSLIEQEIAWVEGRKKELIPGRPEIHGYNRSCDDIIEDLKGLLK